ncbi:MAG: DUF4178 domain-containing protein [Snodgrassella sp.]|nr:DUF4178 domain-containing protein [Snodgrassella sp.]
MDNQSLFFHANCPSCGAEIGVHSATSLTAVCQYCHSVLLINNDQLILDSRCSAVVDDLSPLQIGTTGVWNRKPFVLIGRIQVHYEAGMWNEWHALFADGKSGWLSEAGDRFVFTREQIGETIKLNTLQCGHTQPVYKGRNWIISDIRQIKRGNYEGELPFPLSRQQKVNSIDLRSGKYFMTIENADSATQQKVFFGEGVKLNALQLQHTRTADQIRAQSGRIKGTMQAGKCPSCGGNIQWVSALATYIVCQHCQSSVSLNQDKIQLLKSEKKRDQQKQNLTIKPGSKAWIGRHNWLVLGAVVVKEIPPEDALKELKLPITPSFSEDEINEDDFSSVWTEYLLYSPKKGFLWLIEQEDNQWSLASTLDIWPKINHPSIITPAGFGDEDLRCLYDYGGQVLYAAGAFYWQVKADDINYYRDFGTPKHKLSTTLNPQEQTWSVISEVSATAVATWFQRDKKTVIHAKPMTKENADNIVQEHQSITAEDFRNKKLLYKWWRQSMSYSPYESDIWMMLFTLMNAPLFILACLNDEDETITIGIIVICSYLAWQCLYLNYISKFKSFLIRIRLFPYYAFIIVIIFTSIDWKVYKTSNVSGSSGYHHYNSHWHK